MKKKSELKLYQVRQYVMAKDAMHAIKIARKTNQHEVWIDDEWKKGQHNELAQAIGFYAPNENI